MRWGIGLGVHVWCVVRTGVHVWLVLRARVSKHSVAVWSVVAVAFGEKLRIRIRQFFFYILVSQLKLHIL